MTIAPQPELTHGILFLLYPNANTSRLLSIMIIVPPISFTHDSTNTTAMLQDEHPNKKTIDTIFIIFLASTKEANM